MTKATKTPTLRKPETVRVFRHATATRIETMLGVVIAALVGGTLWQSMSYVTARAEVKNAELAANQHLVSTYLERHLCVVADMQDGHVTRYRCDMPRVNLYLSAQTVQEQAIALNLPQGATSAEPRTQ